MSFWNRHCLTGEGEAWPNGQVGGAVLGRRSTGDPWSSREQQDRHQQEVGAHFPIHKHCTAVLLEDFRDFHPIQSADCKVVQILLSYCLLKFINDDTYGCFYSQEADGHEGLQCGPYQPALRPPHDSQGVIGDCVKKPSSINMWFESPFGVTYTYLCLVIVQHYLCTDKYVLSRPVWINLW